MSNDVIGWASSTILLLTVAKQVHKQWVTGGTEGVSKWLFIGNLAASVGFATYSWLIHNWVYVVTNALMILNNIAGYVILMRNRRRKRAESPA
jgi:MtN3 and saliva related transmembrane protein